MYSPKIKSVHPYYISLGFKSRNRYEMDLSYEVLKIDIGQGATEISEVKVGGQKKTSADSADPG